MNIQVLSDTHIDYLETSKFSEIYEKAADTIVLCGDIGEAKSKKYEDFLTGLSKKFKYVIIIAGNHEYYFSEFHSINKKIEEICKKLGNIFFLNNSVLKLENVIFIGTTLWYDLKPEQYELVKNKMNDFNYIDINSDQKVRRLTPEDVKAMYDKNIDWLDSQLSLTDHLECGVVVLTHHAPLSVGTSNKSYEAKINGTLGYSNNLYNFIKSHRINYWIFGHTHYKCYFAVDKTVIISNPVGYKGEKTRYDKKCVIKL